MRRPWFEATPSLAAAGVSAIAAAVRPTHPLIWRLRMIGLPDFAFAEILNGPAKPRAFPDLRALALHIERARQGQAMELVDVEDIEIEGRDGLFSGVQVFTLLADNSRDRSLGYAWLKGEGRERLEPALRQVRPSPERVAA